MFEVCRVIGPCRLKSPIRAVPAVAQGVQTIPAGELIVVVEDSPVTGLAEVLWQGRAYLVFEGDLTVSATLVKAESDHGGSPGN
jgi:hypothetical protein